MDQEAASDEATRSSNELARRWADAELRGDTGTLRDLLHDDFVGIGPRGVVLGKHHWIDRHATHALEYSEFTWDEPRVHVHGPVAVIVARHHAHGIQAGNAFDGRFRGMMVLVRAEDGWRIAAVQLGPIVEAAQPRPAYATP